MEIFIVDTNVFLRFLLKDNTSLYKKAESIFLKAKTGKVKLFVPSIVIFEISFILNSTYKFAKEEIIHNIESLLSTDYLIIDDLTIFHQAIALYKTSSNSFADCFILAKSKLEGCQLFTFDKKLSKSAKKAS